MPYLYYPLRNPLVLALGVSLLLHLLLIAAPLPPWSAVVINPASAPRLTLKLSPETGQPVFQRPAPEAIPSPSIRSETTDLPVSAVAPAPHTQNRADERAEPAFTSPPLLRLPAGTMDAISEQPLQSAPFDPRLRRQLNAVRSERQRPPRDFIETGEAGSLAPQPLRVGDHCFLYREKDALDEDSFDVWSPVQCSP